MRGERINLNSCTISLSGIKAAASHMGAAVASLVRVLALSFFCLAHCDKASLQTF